MQALDKTNWAKVFSNALAKCHTALIFSPFVRDDAAAFLLRYFGGHNGSHYENA